MKSALSVADELKKESEETSKDVTDQEIDVKKQLGIEDERFNEIKQIFGHFDEDRTGTISFDRLGCVLRGLGFNVTEKEVERIANVHDKDGRGLMDLTDFISILKSHEFSGPELFEKDVISHFAVFDRKKDGYISQNDFIEILTQMQEVFSAQDVNNLWKEVKVDGDGRIDYVDFVHHMFETSRPPIGLSPWIDDEEKYAELSEHAIRAQ
mmetsp:Transcript_9943/g.18107  ORF Transcript_9943/g.18107 Transcript_9943/m.18107 type:complete len:210 (+) Transcript_9943:72-701(+)|eukprot:CAMPEP_0197530362 /NCGR_PEP_ID=MMETSP1318-20131121/31559_1 /TAXON_ID=552666 /ORGANISM="Partenskyella glossopodia, Strain RCC365" /LENGTH=209 /DNA_ID=CAMNT_0043086153 /DNA_START=64 /DNA_END=693 /DNA_ORIENTATION=-